MDATSDSVPSLQVATFVDAFGDIFTIPVEDAAGLEQDGDGVLARYGTYSTLGRPMFELDLTRQFTEPGDDREIWQLSCTLLWSSRSRHRRAAARRPMSFGMPSRDFLAQVRHMPAFAWALQTTRNAERMQIAFEHV
jgi:hypothetical protein